MEKDEVKARFVPRTLRIMADQLDARLKRGEGLPGRFEGWLARDFTGTRLEEILRAVPGTLRMASLVLPAGSARETCSL